MTFKDSKAIYLQIADRTSTLRTNAYRASENMQHRWRSMPTLASGLTTGFSFKRSSTPSGALDISSALAPRIK